jgi:hypothetical protein
VLPLAALTTWIWGLLASSFVVLAALQAIRSRVRAQTPWIGLAIGVAIGWVATAVFSVLDPALVSGTDPTIVPMAALGLPVMPRRADIATGYALQLRCRQTRA